MQIDDETTMDRAWFLKTLKETLPRNGDGQLSDRSLLLLNVAQQLVPPAWNNPVEAATLLNRAYRYYRQFHPRDSEAETRRNVSLSQLIDFLLDRSGLSLAEQQTRRVNRALEIMQEEIGAIQPGIVPVKSSTLLAIRSVLLNPIDSTTLESRREKAADDDDIEDLHIY